ncbi:MAG: QueT transporter family protein [Verrucomicrobiae bacterium]|nr:QueT transporter family protein [Verrucomicrobiae bacterium]
MKEFFEQLEKMTAAFQDPEYLFLVLEPLMVWGVLFGLIGLVVTYFLKNEKLQVVSLIVIIVSALTVVPYLQARGSAQERIESVYKVSDPSRAKGFHTNTLDRREHRWLYLALAGIAGAAVLVGPRRNRLGFGLAVGSVAFSLYAINYGLWMQYQDSLAYHANLKQNEAPVKDKIRAQPVEEEKKTETVSAKPVSQPKKETPPESATRREVRPLTAGTQ